MLWPQGLKMAEVSCVTSLFQLNRFMQQLPGARCQGWNPKWAKKHKERFHLGQSKWRLHLQHCPAIQLPRINRIPPPPKKKNILQDQTGWFFFLTINLHQPISPQPVEGCSYKISDMKPLILPIAASEGISTWQVEQVDVRWISILPTEHRLLPMPLFKPTKLDGIWSDGLPVWAQQKWTTIILVIIQSCKLELLLLYSMSS